MRSPGRKPSSLPMFLGGRADRGRYRSAAIGILTDACVLPAPRRRAERILADGHLRDPAALAGGPGIVFGQSCTRSIRPPCSAGQLDIGISISAYGLFVIGCGIAGLPAAGDRPEPVSGSARSSRRWRATRGWPTSSGLRVQMHQAHQRRSELCAGRTGRRAAGRPPVAVARSRPFLPAAGLQRSDRRRPRQRSAARSSRRSSSVSFESLNSVLLPSMPGTVSYAVLIAVILLKPDGLFPERA